MKQKFTRNLGPLDRILRGGIGLGGIYFGFYSSYLITDRLAGLVLGGMGVMSVVVAVISICPLYTLIGFSTLKQETRPSH